MTLLRGEPLSADEPLGLLEKITWVVRNTVHAIAGELVPAAWKLDVSASRDIVPGPLQFEDETGRATQLSSPGRALSVDLTIRVCRLLNERLREPVSVLDLGCGSGGYAPFFQDRLTRFGSYTGVDPAAHDAWEKQQRLDGVEFIRCPAEEFVLRLDRNAPYNFVYSNSALEHVRDDVGVLFALGRWAADADHPVIQLHVVPATMSLPLYRGHGYRAYSSADISRVRALFAPARTLVVGLGGPRSWALHLLRLGEREHRPERYAVKLRRACNTDIASDGQRLPIMWGLVALPAEWAVGE